jgi:hypothetical protein
VLGFEGNSLTGEILRAEAVARPDVIRLIDRCSSARTSGEVTVMEATTSHRRSDGVFATVGADRTRRSGRGGGVAGAVAGAGRSRTPGDDEHEIWYVTDSIPNGSAAVALLEHRWAIP